MAAGPASTGTCAEATPASNIDYFIVGRRLQDALGEVKIITNSTLKTHRPVRLYWKPKMEEIRIRTLETKKLPSARVVALCQNFRHITIPSQGRANCTTNWKH